MQFITNNFDKYYPQNVIFTAEIQSTVETKLALPINFIFKVLLENTVNNSTTLQDCYNISMISSCKMLKTA